MEAIFSLPADQRGCLVGQTGTGKSTLARYLTQDKRNLIIIDPKRDFDPPRDCTIIDNPDALTNMTNDCILYRPKPEASEPEDYDRVFHWIYNRGHTFVYIDELTAVSRSAQSYPLWLRALYTQGRSMGIGIIGSTQRPSGVPLFVFSESRKFWKFYLLMGKDNERMAEWMGDEVLDQHHDVHSFYYRDTLVRQGRSREFLLTIKETAKTSPVNSGGRR